jgi:hypothetical protein
MAVQLGQKVVDCLTGFTGVATAKTEYLYGCVRVLVEPTELSTDGKPVEGIWLDEQRLDPTSEATTGGPGPVPPGRDPSR